jgi:hypothetical protein
MVLELLLRIGELLSVVKRIAVLIAWKCHIVSNTGILQGCG